jgi:hypothetical protein
MVDGGRPTGVGVNGYGSFDSRGKTTARSLRVCGFFEFSRFSGT